MIQCEYSTRTVSRSFHEAFDGHMTHEHRRARHLLFPNVAYHDLERGIECQCDIWRGYHDASHPTIQRMEMARTAHRRARRMDDERPETVRDGLLADLRQLEDAAIAPVVRSLPRDDWLCGTWGRRLLSGRLSCRGGP